METEKDDYLEDKDIRQEIQYLKDRINLIEAILDINEWRKISNASKDFDRTDEELDSIV